MFLPSGPNELTSSLSVWMATHGMEGVLSFCFQSRPYGVLPCYTLSGHVKEDLTHLCCTWLCSCSSPTLIYVCMYLLFLWWYLMENQFNKELWIIYWNHGLKILAGPICLTKHQQWTLLLGPVQDTVCFYIFCVLHSNILTV